MRDAWAMILLLAALLLVVVGGPSLDLGGDSPADRVHLRTKGHSARARRPKVRLWERVLAKRFRKARQLQELARRARVQRRFKVAVRYLRRALAIRGDSAALWYALGRVYYFQGRNADCIPALKRARRLDPRHAQDELAFTLGVCLTLADRLVEGIREYQRVRPHLYPRRKTLYWNLGDSFMALGRLDDAIAQYFKALKQRGPATDPVLFFALAVAFDRQGRPQNADRWIVAALRRDTRAASLYRSDIIWLPGYDKHYYRALAFMGRGRLTRAIAQWREFVTKAKRSPWQMSIRGRVARLASMGPEPNQIQGATAAVKSDALVKALTASHGRLRRCLRAPISGNPGLKDLAAASVEVEAAPGGLRSVKLKRKIGPVKSGAVSCLTGVLRGVPWRGIIAAGKTEKLTFEIVAR